MRINALEMGSLATPSRLFSPNFMVLRAGLDTISDHRLGSRFSLIRCQILASVFTVFRLPDVASLAFCTPWWILFGSSGSSRRLRQFSNLRRQLKSLRSRTSVSVTGLTVNHRSTLVSRVLPKTKSSTLPRTGIPSRVCLGFRQCEWRMHRRGARVVGCRTATASTGAVSQILEPR